MCCIYFSSKYWREHYFFIFCLSVLVSWLFRDYVARDGHLNLIEGENKLSRALATTVFFGALMVAVAGVRNSKAPRGRLHSAFFPLKLLSWALIVVAFLFISNASARTYFEVSRAGAAVFLLLQLVAILDAVYTANERWLQRAEAGETSYRWRLVFLALLTNGGTLAGIVVMFVLFPDNPRSIGFICATLAIFVILTGVSLLPGVNGGVLTSGAVSLYCTFLCAVAVLNDPDTPGTEPRWLQVVGFLIALGTLLYTAQDVGKTSLRDIYGDRMDDDEEVHPLMYSVFHFVYACGSMYSNMLFSNWSYASALEQFDLEKGIASMWVKIACEWAVAALYLWMLAAPAVGRRLCPGRDFGGGGVASGGLAAV